MKTARERALVTSILAHVASGGVLPADVVEKAREAAVPTRLDEERLRKAAEKRERKRNRAQ